jgi:Putative sensor
MITDTAVLPTMASPMTSAPAPPRRPGIVRQLGVDTAYSLVGFPIAIAAFVVVVTGLSVGAGLLVVWVGVAVLAATLLAARGFASVERAWLPSVLGRPVPRPAYRSPEGSTVRKLITPLRDPQTWLDALHGIVRFPVAIVSFVVTVTFWSIALGGVTYGAWDWALPDASRDPDNDDLLELLGIESTAGSRIALYTAIGILFAVLLPFAVRAVALLQAQLSRVLLTSRATTQAELGRLTESRNAAVAAEAVALRRLERDIHDGPQQQLVRAEHGPRPRPAAARARPGGGARGTR